MVGNRLYFDSNNALWTSDGTAAGTLKLANLYVYNQLDRGGFVDLNGIAVFAASQSGVWRSDGTPAGTTQITPIATGSVTQLGDHVYFFGTAPGSGIVSLWKSDGTPEGTSLVREFSTPYVSGIHATVNGRLYFWASDSALNTGVEPWSSDGTPEGTVPLGDLAPGTNSSGGVNFASLSGFVYFTAATVPNSESLTLFRTDGSAGSATAIATIGSNSYSYEQPGLFVYNNAMYFRGNKSGHGPELWRSDGTAAGTDEFIDINPGSAGSYPTAFQIYNGRFYFEASKAGEGFEMRSTDGTVAGTMRLKEIAPGSSSIDDSYTLAPTILNGRMYFQANDVAHGTELWSTDGTSDGTTLLKDINTSTLDFNASTMTLGPGGNYYFTANDGIHGTEIWKTDGTAAGTSLLKDITPNGSSQIGPFTFANNLLLFYAVDSAGAELWRSDGTEAGTFRVKDIMPGPGSGSDNGVLVKVGNQVFFSARQSTSVPLGLWISDGTEAGTHVVKPADVTFEARNFSGIALNGKLIFTAMEGSFVLLYLSDGTEQGTTLLREGLSEQSIGLANGSVFNGKVYFPAYMSAAGNELWSTDGTPAGTTLVSDIVLGPSSSSPSFLISTPNYLYFVANSRELWRIDRITSTTTRELIHTSNIQQMRSSAKGGVIFTTATNQLFRFDNSTLIPLNASSFTAAPNLLGSANRMDYFAATTSAAGNELWRSNGTSAGTSLVQDLYPGTNGSFPTNLSAVGRDVFVSAVVPGVGRELFTLPPFELAAIAPRLGPDRTLPVVDRIASQVL
jgi:ELWxxDGT repeat protein